MRVRIIEHDPSWSELFEAESQRLNNLLGEAVDSIEHIGSTAVSGLIAEPIIDILISVDSLDAFDEKTEQLEQIGYEAMGEFGIPSRRYCRKDNAAGERTHQIHAFEADSADLQRHIAFREYLKAHTEIASEYGRLKSDLASRYATDLDGYVAGKDSFIKDHERRALKWFALQAQ